MFGFIFINVIIKVDHFLYVCQRINLLSISISLSYTLEAFVPYGYVVSCRFITHFVVSLDLLTSLSSSIKYEYVFVLIVQNSFVNLPPNSSLNNPITFLFLPIGRGLLSFSS